MPIKPPLQQSDTARAPCLWIERGGRGQKTKISQPTPRRIEKRKFRAKRVEGGKKQRWGNSHRRLRKRCYAHSRKKEHIPVCATNVGSNLIICNMEIYMYSRCSAAAHEQIIHTHRKNLHTTSPSHKMWASSCGQKASTRQPTTSVKSCVRKMWNLFLHLHFLCLLFFILCLQIFFSPPNSF